MKRVHQLPENMYLKKVRWCEINWKYFKLFGHTRLFCFRTQPKNLNFQKCFTSKRHFVEWLYVLVMSRTRFRVNPHSVVGWISRNSLFESCYSHLIPVTSMNKNNIKSWIFEDILKRRYSVHYTKILFYWDVEKKYLKFCFFSILWKYIKDIIKFSTKDITWCTPNTYLTKGGFRTLVNMQDALCSLLL